MENPLCKHERMIMEGVTGKTMCELGAKYNPRGVYKDWFHEWKHVSIDLNGEAGSLIYDLEKPIPLEEIGGPFDVVTNFGTSEHVNEQVPCWENIHRLVKVGGVLVSATPFYFPRHGRWYPTHEWYTEFVISNHYEEEMRFKAIDTFGRSVICIRMRKMVDLPLVFPTAPMIERHDGRCGAYVLPKEAAV